ncbi:uncharacterized protein LOC135221344 [Macrobrachium nipponense]|uniref:uncharacterized protein LOC135221344 n=1 Tax=Macrobrachium nipponense TaxID=159736 RepID=UPI0030C8D3DB
MDHMMPMKWAKKWPHLNDVPLKRLPAKYNQVELIIGLKSSLGRCIYDQRHGEENEPSAHLTRFGWVTFGPTGFQLGEQSWPLHHIQLHEYEAPDPSSITNCLQSHFNKDFWETEIHSHQEASVEDKLFLDKVSKSIQRIEGKYCLNLPFHNKTPLPHDREYVVHRMKVLQRKFEKNNEYKAAYVEQMQILDKGYAELVPLSALACNDRRVWYIPHYSVIHTTKLKLRVVYDLKAKFSNISLNDLLLQGHDLKNTVIGVLLRFRQGQYAVTADIQEMLFQLLVPEGDRDILRILWWPGSDTNQPLSEYRMRGHVFGARSSPSYVNYALRRIAEDHGLGFNDEASEAICCNFYVDNLPKAFNDKDLSMRTAKDLIALCNAGGWRLNQWSWNCKEVLSTIPESERDISVATLDLSKYELPTERALGVHWSMEEYSFTFKVCLKDMPLTQRGALSMVMSIYDPMSMVVVATLPLKLIIQ